ncbi:ribose-5-phosphate isomerase [Tessaracoccus sp. MC1865]|uniref:ribose-5-phosphate isomerase n=1 Tax=Tessaracoccus sp. MC1865 TaxID=2760310 RepID=UPI001600BB52|nr:ribose-5-phosphate isomerase [Tessaracoccus sp. MC1865]MBB1483007.1 ribose-5-phosphate isomerase [Tessaracoccus sp. MC1865]QTO37557.1 ribose-5-phosphate isomerase [Tessaracoccus sp. MC1865]
MGYRIVLAADQAGVGYKDAIAALLATDDRVDAVIDVGVKADTDPTAYPHLAVEGARLIAAGEADRGIFVCGTGMGVAIAANKVPGVRASTAHDSYSVERLVKSNNGQVLCLGERVIGRELALKLVSEFLGHVFDPESPSNEKVHVIEAYEEEEKES